MSDKLGKMVTNVIEVEKNGVKVVIKQQYNKEINDINIDFSEHDKVFEDKIADLQQRIRELIKEKDEYKRKCNDFGFENQDLKKITKGYEDKIAKLEKQIDRLNEEKSFLRTRCMPYVEKDFDNRLYGKLAIVSCNEEFVDIQKYADGDDLYSREVRNLISEGGIKRLIGQYKNISARLDKISAENKELKQRINELESFSCQAEQETESLVEKLKQRIAELESKETETCGKEPKISDSAPSREWYENRHQSDCIEINRLNTTIDVLIHKVEYLRQFAGLE